MGMMSPVFRETNYSRILKLRKNNYRDSTIANMLSDEIGTKVTASDVRGYIKLNGIGSNQMLVSRKALSVAEHHKDPDPLLA